MSHIAVLQDPTTGATSLTDEITEANFKAVVYRPATAGSTIVQEDGQYVELSADCLSRKVLFAVKAAS